MAYIEKQAPRYEFAFDTLDPPAFHYYDSYQDIYVINVEQGRRFYMKFKLRAFPKPTSVELYKDGKLVKSTSRGTIFVGEDSIGVQLVDKTSYSGVYTILSTNEMGSGQISFKIDVKPTPGYVQPVDDAGDSEPSRW